jgi:hypothetical protein
VTAELDGDVIIEWPPASSRNWAAIRVYDAATGEPRNAVIEMHVYANAEGVATVETVELTDGDGVPLDGGNSVVRLVGGELPTRSFRYALAGVRVRE